jgi:hypothetical protein
MKQPQLEKLEDEHLSILKEQSDIEPKDAMQTTKMISHSSSAPFPPHPSQIQKNLKLMSWAVQFLVQTLPPLVAIELPRVLHAGYVIAPLRPKPKQMKTATQQTHPSLHRTAQTNLSHKDQEMAVTLSTHSLLLFASAFLTISRITFYFLSRCSRSSAREDIAVALVACDVVNRYWR